MFAPSARCDAATFRPCRSDSEFVLEGILRAVVAAITKSAALEAALNGTRIPAPHEKAMQAGGTNVGLTVVNDAMLYESLCLAAWQALGLPSGVPFPSLPGEMLYGGLCSSIPSPGLKSVCVLDKDEEEAATVELFAEAANLGEKEVVGFSAADAAAVRGAQHRRVRRKSARVSGVAGRLRESTSQNSSNDAGSKLVEWDGYLLATHKS